MRVNRTGPQHCLRELDLRVMLHGNFGAAYTEANNKNVVATDTIKNVVNVVARDNVGSGTEDFCEAIADRLLTRYSQIDRVEITSSETSWARLTTSGQPHPHAFVHDANGMPSVRLSASRSSSVVRSGVTGYTFLKATGSGWSGYVQDDYTTLPQTADRIAATSMNAEWGWSSLPPDSDEVRASILSQMLDVFANTFSASVQDSLFRMGQAALSAVENITDITLSCPNKHYLPVDLSPFGMNSDNMIFTPTDEPHGQIECNVCR